jgi:hypothetical protein
MKILNSDDGGGSAPCDAGVMTARERTLQAIKLHMKADPEGWPEHLAQVADTACGLHCWSMNLHSDAAAQVAGMSRRLEAERRDEMDGPPVVRSL